MELNGEITDVYEVGVDGVKEISETNHGEGHTVIYKVTYSNGEYVFIGLLKEDIEKRVNNINEKIDFQKQLSFDHLMK